MKLLHPRWHKPPRRLVAAMVLPSLGLCCLFPGTAHAGTWTITVTGITTPPGYFVGPPQSDPNHRTVTGNVGLFTPVSVSLNSGELGTTSPSKATSTTYNVTVTGTYHPSQGETMPSTAQMLEKGSVGVSGGETVNYTWNVSGSDGLGETINNPTWTNGYNPNSGATGSYISGSASGAHLITVSCPTFTLTRTATASIQGAAASWGGGTGYTYSIAQDTRKVTLSRNSLDWKDSSGGTHGATTFSMVDSLTGWSSYNWQRVNANFSGNWSSVNTFLGPETNVTYSWSPNESDDSMLIGNWEVMAGSLSVEPTGVYGSPDPPQTRTITYTATDPKDGATASASYTFHVHDQFDNLRPDPNGCYAPTKCEYFYAHPDGQGYYCVGNLNGTTSSATSSVAISGQVQAKLGLSGDMTLPILGTLKPGLELLLQVNQTFTIGTQVSNIPNNSEEFPEALVTWPVYYDVVDEYSQSGFVQTSEEYYEDLSHAVVTLGWSKPVPIGSLPPDTPIGN